MTALALARWQFAITTVYHFFFVPLTLGLSILVAVMETLYVRRGDEVYKRLAKFWGKLLVINFAMTGLTIILSLLGLAIGLYPRVMVSSLSPDWSLTIYNASSSDYTLRVMSIVALIFVPIVLIYQGWSYYIFRQRLGRDDVLEY